MENFEDKTVVITGGSGQVGTACAKKFGELGCTVISLVRRDVDKSNSLMKQISPKCSALLVDVTDSKSLKKVAKKIGKCDILINAAGYTRSISPSKLNELTDEIFDEIVDINLKGTFLAIREFVPYMKDSVVINLSSTAGLRASQSNLAYGAAKAGIDLITKTLGKSLAPNIRVVGIAPGYLYTPTSGAININKDNEQQQKEFIKYLEIRNGQNANITPLKRVGQGEDIADMILSVIQNKHITGQTIVVDGGITL